MFALSSLLSLSPDRGAGAILGSLSPGGERAGDGERGSDGLSSGGTLPSTLIQRSLRKKERESAKRGARRHLRLFGLPRERERESDWKRGENRSRSHSRE